MAKALEIIKQDLAKLGEAEKTTKGLVAQCTIDVLAFVHEHGQGGMLNEMLLVLSPANAKAVTAFFRHFSGFQYVKEEQSFTKKIRATHDKGGNLVEDKYANCKVEFAEFVAEGKNFWQWFNAQGKVDKNVEAKPLDLAKLTASVKKAAEKAEKQGISKTALFNAVVGEVFSPTDILELLGAAIKVNKVVDGAILKAKAEINPAAEAAA